MAGPGLSTSNVAATTGPPAWANTVSTMVNRFDNSGGTTGYVLMWNGSLWISSSIYAALPAGTTITLAKVAGAWPGVPTTRTDIIFIWKGPDPAPANVSSRTLGSAGILDGVDMNFVTP